MTLISDEALELSETDPSIGRLHIGGYTTAWIPRDDATMIYKRLISRNGRIRELTGELNDLVDAIAKLAKQARKI